jgi:hypothetical protein
MVVEEEEEEEEETAAAEGVLVGELREGEEEAEAGGVRVRGRVPPWVS